MIAAKDLERFWSKTRRDGECIIWTAAVCKDGYGKFATDLGRSRQKHHRAHRWIYERLVGPIDAPLLRHSCDNPRCVNPSHLSPGSQLDNLRDQVERGRSQFGERNANSKLSWEQVVTIRAAVASGERQVDVAARFGLTRSHVNILVRRACWKGSGR